MLSRFVASNLSKRGFDNAVKRNFSTTRNISKPFPTFANTKINVSQSNVSTVLFPQRMNHFRLYSTPVTPVTPVVTPVVPPVTPPVLPTPPPQVVQVSDVEVTQVIDLLKTSLEQPPSVLENIIYPTEWWRALMNFLHETVGLPWWGVFFSMAVVTRTFTFPLAVRQMRNAPIVKARNEELGNLMQEMKIASQLGDQAKSLALQKRAAELWNPKDLLYGLIPMPIFITAFMGVQGLVQRNVESLHHEGLLWFKDLAAADPYYGLPTASLVFGALSLIFVDVPTATVRKMLPFILLLVVVGFYMTREVPAGVHVYWSSAALLGLLQIVLLRKTPLKRILKIPDNPNPLPKLFTKPVENVVAPPPKVFTNPPPSFNMYKNKKPKNTTEVK